MWSEKNENNFDLFAPIFYSSLKTTGPTDWRSNNNIAESLFQQMEKETHPSPHWIVVGAGTGGTSATLGRYVRYRADKYNQTKICVADPDNSVF